jgi:hypothetical protein
MALADNMHLSSISCEQSELSSSIFFYLPQNTSLSIPHYLKFFILIFLLSLPCNRWGVILHSGLCMNAIKEKLIIRALAFVALLLLSQGLWAQSGLYVPTTKPIKDMKRALTNPEVFHLLLFFNPADSLYSESDLDLLDSAYRIAFDINNPKYYTMTVESYGGDTLSAKRLTAVMRYFCDRCHARFPIRVARNPIHCSCHGDTVETLRYEVPVTRAVYNNMEELPESRRVLNQSIRLDESVLVTFRNDPDECVGSSRGCFTPAADSTVWGYNASIFFARGSVYAVDNTKDTCPGGFEASIEDHLNYRYIVENYTLIPHRKQLLVQAGYMVLKSNYARSPEECEMEQKDSIFVRIPATQEQLEAKLKFFAKVKTPRGIEYKAMPTRKMPGKGELMLQAPISVDQMDTIYVGKRIKEDELKDYFYEVDSPTEAASFEAAGRYFVAYRVDKHGHYELKKALKKLFRITEEESLTPDPSPSGEGGRNQDPEEIIEN